MLTLANISLPLPTAELCAWVRTHLPIEHAVPFTERGWPGSLLSTNAVSFPSRPRATRYVELNTYSHPAGADRFGLGFFLADASTADKIRDAANGDDGSESNPITLAMETDNNDEPMSVDVALLKITPLAQLPAGDNGFQPNNLYVLTVVDSRYFAQFQAAPDFGIPPYGASISISLGGLGATVPSWAALVAACGTTLGTTISTSTIPSAYLSPDPSLNVAGAPLGPVTQAVLDNIGMRLAFQLSGNWVAQNAADAQAARAADIAANPKRQVIGGGDLFVNDL